MKIINLIIIVIILYIIYNNFKNNKEHMINNIEFLNKKEIPKNLNDYIQKKFIYPKENNTYINKIKKPHNELDKYFKTDNNDMNQKFNLPTISEIENSKFSSNFISSIYNKKNLIEPNIDNTSQDPYYIKSDGQGNTLYKIDNWMYDNEGVINGGNFFNKIHGYDSNNNNYYY
jgi:hypothetical protein